MKIRYAILNILIMILIFSCGKWREKLSIKKEIYINKDLRLDGIWRTTPDLNGRMYEYFLYENGVVWSSGSTSMTLQETLDLYASYSEKDWKSIQTDVPYRWGVFNIRKKKIIMEHWTSDDMKYRVKRLTGDILSDTSFVITKWSGKYKGNEPSHNHRRDTFYFQKFYPKPDSTNIFTN